jgi:hypothetical protein
MCEALFQYSNLAFFFLAISVSNPAITWGLLALLFTCVLYSWLKTGTTWTPDEGVIYTRKRDHFHYNAWIFWAALIATIFVGASIAFYFYSNARGPMIRDELPAHLRD